MDQTNGEMIKSPRFERKPARMKAQKIGCERTSASASMFSAQKSFQLHDNQLQRHRTAVQVLLYCQDLICRLDSLTQIIRAHSTRQVDPTRTNMAAGLVELPGRAA